MLSQNLKISQIVKIDTIRTIKTVHDTVFVNSKDSQSLDLINKVDTFYNNAWTKLAVTVTLLFIIVGIVVPLIIQWYQKKQLKLSEDRLLADISVKTSESLIQLEKNIDAKSAQSLEQLKADIVRESLDNLTKLKEEIQNEYQEALVELRKENDKNIEELKLIITNKGISSMTHLQGLMAGEKEEYEEATYNFIFALLYSLKSNSKPHQTFFNNIGYSLKRCSRKNLDKYFKHKEKDFLETIKQILELLEDDGFKDELKEIEKIYIDMPEIANEKGK
ncbi:hypothetical protein [Pedobacter boryungensis]|uniref:Uncharacterized protein n=1 Tax=Pedobacter boryungensis TaxID=869962 RepID=A0ABX2DH59_9SPHI|nr:hypothetical protein [Pedobacter boryungensis]NQX32464.1 hypothetical protein [Pedobacter boryungensis]